VAWLIAQIGVFHATAVPDSFDRIDKVVPKLAGIVETDFIKNEELRFRPEKGRVADPRELQIGFGLLRNVAGVSGVALLGDRIDHITDHGQGRDRHKGIHNRSRCVRNDQHVTGMNRLPATDARTVKAIPVFKVGFAQLFDGIAKMLPGTDKIQEFEIHHLGALLFGQRHYFLRGHDNLSL